MKDPRFRRGLKISTTVHLVVLGLLAAWPLLNRLVNPPKAPEIITFVDLVAGSPAPPAPAAVVKQPEPEPEPPKPQPKPEPEPEPEKPIPEPPAKPEKPKIKVNTNRIVRKNDVVPPKPVKPTLTKEQIARALEQGVKFTSVGPSSGGVPGGSTDPLVIYYSRVRDVMYGAWRQPSGAGASGIRTQVRVKVLRSGAVISRQLVSGSGSAVMDASVMTAVQSVAKLPSFPPEVPGDSQEIVVEFVLEGP